MHLSLRGGRRATAAAMATSIAVVGLLSSGCTPPPAANKVISGTVKGVDGRIVDVMLGYDVLDGFGNKIDMGSIRVGYSAIQRLNHCVPTYGATTSQKCPTSGDVTGYNWSLRLPSNAAKVYVEVYPKAPTSTSWLNNYRGYTGPAAGDTNISTYGMVYERALDVTWGSRSNVSIVLPKVCSAGGTTGSLMGHIWGWPNGAQGTVDAWSMAPDAPTMGFGIGNVDGNGNYRIDGLQRNQRYGLIANGPGFSRNAVTDTNSVTDATLIPAACFGKAYNF